MLIVQGVDQPRDLGAIDLCHVRVQEHGLLNRFGQESLDLGLAGFQLRHPVLHPAAGHTIE